MLNVFLNKVFHSLKLLDVILIVLINLKMPTIVGIFIFMSRISFMLMKRFLCNLGSSTVEKMVFEYAECFFLNKDFHCFKTPKCYFNRANKC